MRIKITLIALLMCFSFYAQNFKEKQLPVPDKISQFFIGALIKSTIHYGATPPNYNGKVVVFNHGYLDLNQSHFLSENTFYEKAYNDGYQTVFVATTRGGGIWKNGKLIAEAIDIITNKYNVPNLYLITHSNGGKAAETAMIRYNKKDKVKRVFALSTPFWGTYIADISQMPFLRWAWRLTGLNEGANTSTTYYCTHAVRPYLDEHPNNEPEKFIVLAATGYNHGSKLATRIIFTATGSLILPFDGPNDGVASYNSTLRPNATYIFEKNDPRADIDHSDINRGRFTWSYIKDYIENNDKTSQISVTPSIPQNKIIKSNFYIIHSENKHDRIVLDKNSSYAVADIIHEDPKANITIKDQFGAELNNQKKYHPQDNKTIIPINGNNRILSSTSRFAAFIKQNNGVTMSLEHKTTTNGQILKVDFTDQKKEKIALKTTKVRAIITRTSNLNGKPIEEEPQIIHFELKANSFFFDPKNLEEGVYSMLITGENDQNFKRNIISGFVIGDIKKGLTSINTNDLITPKDRNISIAPNAIREYAQLSLKGYSKTAPLLLNIYDITGKEIKQSEIDTKGNSEVDISDHLQTLASGIYILQVNNDQTLKFIKE